MPRAGAYVSIFSCLALWPDSRRSRRLIPLKRSCLGGEVGDLPVHVVCGSLSGDSGAEVGGGGISFVGGGFGGSKASARVLKVVPLVSVVDGTELENVLLEKELESDWRGRAVFDL